MNIYAWDFNMICKLPQDDNNESNVVHCETSRSQEEHESWYNLQLCKTKVRIIINARPHDLVLRAQGARLHSVFEINPHITPLHFRLIFHVPEARNLYSKGWSGPRGPHQGTGWPNTSKPDIITTTSSGWGISFRSLSVLVL